MANLQRNIMRRIYTAYMLRMLFGTRARHTFILLLSVWGIVKYVSVVDVAYNFSSVTVGEAGYFIVNALRETEAYTLALLALFCYAAYIIYRGDRSVKYHIRRSHTMA